MAAYHELPGAPAHHMPMQQGPSAEFRAPATQSGDLTRESGNPLVVAFWDRRAAEMRSCCTTGSFKSSVAGRDRICCQEHISARVSAQHSLQHLPN